MGIADVRTAIATAAAAVTSSPDLTCTAYVPDSITEPHFFCAEIEADYSRTYGGATELRVTARVLVGTVDDRSSQELLDAYLDPSGAASLKAAIEAWTAPAGFDDIHVQRMQGYRWYEHAGVRYLGAELTIRVI